MSQAFQIRWGTASLEAGGAGWATSKVTFANAAGVLYETEVTAAVEGHFTGTTAELVQKCAALEAALARPGQDLVLLGTSGQTLLSLRNSNSTTGTRCLDGPHYPDYAGAELVTFRHFRFTIVAAYPLVGGAAVLLEFAETVETSGGGPVFDFQRPFNARPIKVQIYPATEFRATQQGYAVVQATSPVAYAAPTKPAFPSALLEVPPIRRSSKRTGARRWELRTEWAYQFGSAQPLPAAVPNAWR